MGAGPSGHFGRTAGPDKMAPRTLAKKKRGKKEREELPLVL
jgi:hypothetical protein